MKNLISYSSSVIIIFIILTSCKSLNRKATINGFVNNYFVIKNEEIKIEDLQKYINYDKLTFNSLTIYEREKLNEYFNFMIDIGYKNLKMNDFQFKIYSSYEINPNLILHYNILYHDKKSIYYMVSKDKLFCFFILDKNNKIISFFSRDFMSQGKDIEPFILTSKNNLESLLKN